MNPYVNIATQAARDAGRIILRYSNRLDAIAVESKARNDFVSEVDRAAEQTIIQRIRRAYPRHAILAEESGHRGGGEFEWIIDPLDGTTNYLHGIPHYAVSIALRHRGELKMGVIYDPFKEELFCAARGEGATLNNRRIRVSRRRSLSGALLGTGIPFRPNQNLDLYLETLKALIPDTAGVRRAGSAALDLAYVAAGRFDGFWEFKLHPWDMAAGVVLIREAGGLVGDLQGGQNFLKTGDILAAPPRIFQQMVGILRPLLPRPAEGPR
ncbi:MAG TPA: inositol monophosphatase [Chromatiales bacterium]|nr:inositol monophosphatase [Chromatiales bacterium]